MFQPGWGPHPNDPTGQWAYNPSTNEVKPRSEVLAVTPPTPQHTAAAAAPGFGTVVAGDYEYIPIDMQEQADQRLFEGRGDLIWLDIPAVGKNVGDEASLIVRLLPAFSATRRIASVVTGRHSIPAELHPGAHENAEVKFETCFNISGGPGNCPFCDAVSDIKAAFGDNEDAKKFVDNVKVRSGHLWQGLDMNDLRKHYVALKDERGAPLLDASGQPMYKLVPGLVRVGNQLQGELKSLLEVKGDFTNPFAGYNVRMQRKRDGKGRFDVKYKAFDVDAGPLPQGLHSVLGNMHDLWEMTRQFASRDTAEGVADAMRARWGLAAKFEEKQAAPAAPALPPGFQVHPGDPNYLWNPSTGAVIPKPAEAAPAVPAMPPGFQAHPNDPNYLWNPTTNQVIPK